METNKITDIAVIKLCVRYGRHNVNKIFELTLILDSDKNAVVTKITFGILSTLDEVNCEYMRTQYRKVKKKQT